MTLFDCYQFLINQNISLQKADVYHILEAISGQDKDWIITNFESQQFDLKKLNQIVEELKTGKPLAYILGYQYFYNYKFKVDNRVLIPRPETERLVDFALEFIAQNSTAIVADICTGSGAVGISIAKQTHVQVNLFDLSIPALEVAKQNSDGLECVKLFQGDYLTPVFKNKIVSDIILVNPPYIELNDPDLDLSVLHHEPAIALFAENQGLFFYDNLFQNYQKLIRDQTNFLIVMEFGWKQKEKLEQLANQLLNLETTNFEFIKDYANNWRYIIIKNIKE